MEFCLCQRPAANLKCCKKCPVCSAPPFTTASVRAYGSSAHISGLFLVFCLYFVMENRVPLCAHGCTPKFHLHWNDGQRPRSSTIWTASRKSWWQALSSRPVHVLAVQHLLYESDSVRSFAGHDLFGFHWGVTVRSYLDWWECSPVWVASQTGKDNTGGITILDRTKTAPLPWNRPPGAPPPAGRFMSYFLLQEKVTLSCFLVDVLAI